MDDDMNDIDDMEGTSRKNRKKNLFEKGLTFT